MKSNQWAVVICGPPAPTGFVLKDKRGGTYIMTLNSKLYSVDTLRKWAPTIAGLNVFSSHAAPEHWNNGDYGNPNSHRPRSDMVGFFHSAYWSEAHNEARGILICTSTQWQEALTNRLLEGTLNEIGLSSMWDTLEIKRVKFGGKRLPVVKPVTTWSIDLVSEPLMGGRFLGVGRNQVLETAALKWRLQNIGGLRYE